MNIFNGLILPFKVQSGQIVDGAGKPVIKANRTLGETPLSPAGRDALLYVVADLLNEGFEHDKIDQLQKKHGY